MAYTDIGLNYEPRKRAAGQQRDASLAMNAFSRMLSQQRGARDVMATDKAASKGLEGFGAGYGKRGLRNSGIFKSAASDYSQNWMQQRNDQLDALRQQMAQYNLQDAQSQAGYEGTLGDIELEKQRDILGTAASLQGLRPFLGA
jgi:microsomal dipeptidase-like Zn-dependent dipeptidase